MRQAGGGLGERARLSARLARGRIRAAFGRLRGRDRARLDEGQFDAFLSYSHALDRRTAVALQRGLHRLARPWYRLRALHVFRDDTNLAANPDLWSSITTGLDGARYFVLLASPQAAGSEWVGREVHHWREHKPERRMLLVHTAGGLHWNAEEGDFDWERTDAVPRALAGAFSDEPRYVDLRFARDHEPLSLSNPRFRDAVADLAAAIHERPKDELIGEDIRQHRRTRRVAWAAGLALLALAIAASVAAIVALRERDRAEEQLRLAASRFITQEATQALGKQHSQSLLLALEALELRETPEARSLLYRALVRRPEIVRFMQPTAGVPTEVAFSPDGETLAVPTSGLVGTADTAIVDLWDADSGRLEAPIRVEGVNLLAAAYSASGDTLAVGAEDGSVHLFEAASREVSSEFRPAREYGAVLTLTFAGERRLAAGYSNGVVILWDTESGKPLDRLPVSEPGPVDELSFGPRGRRLAVGSGGATVDIWEVKDSPGFVRPLNLGGTISEAVSFSPRGDTLAVGTVHGDVRLWESRDWTPLVSPPRLPGAVSDLAFSADAGVLAITTNDSDVRLWSARDGKWLRDPLAGHIGSVAAVSFAPSGLGLASAGNDGNLIMWDPTRSDRLAEILPVDGARPVAAEREEPRMALDPAAGRVAWTTNDGRVVLASLDDAPAVPASLSAPPQPLAAPARNLTVSSLAFAPDGEQIGASIDGGSASAESIVLWSAKTGEQMDEPLRAQGAEEGWASSLSFSPDGQTLAAVGASKLHLLNTATGDWEVAPLRGANGQDLEFSPNGGTLAAPVGLEGEVALVDPATLEDTILQTGEAVFVWDVAFSPDGQTLAGGDDDGNVVLWDVASGERLGPPLKGTNVGLQDLAFSPDGTLLASSNFFGQIDLWDVGLRRSLGPSLTGAAPAFGADGELLVALQPGRGLVLRRLDLESWREIGCSLANRNLGEEEWDRFLDGIEDYEPACPGLPRGRPAEAEVAVPGE